MDLKTRNILCGNVVSFVVKKYTDTLPALSYVDRSLHKNILDNKVYEKLHNIADHVV
jgi:hypothetical protein